MDMYRLFMRIGWWDTHVLRKALAAALKASGDVLQERRHTGGLTYRARDLRLAPLQGWGGASLFLLLGASLLPRAGRCFAGGLVCVPLRGKQLQVADPV